MTGEERFWQLVSKLQKEDPRVELGTIMGSRCVRVGGGFLGLYAAKQGGAVIKLPKDRVAALVDEGHGAPFAPAGRVFKEWVLVPDAGSRRWPKLMRDGIAFVGR
jgi:hypothetical protein